MQPHVEDDEYYEDVTDEELAEMNPRCMEYQERMTVGKVRDSEEITLEDSHNRDEDEVDDEAHPQPQPLLPLRHTFHNTTTTLPLNTCASKPHPLS